MTSLAALLGRWSRSATPDYCDYTRRTDPRPADELGGVVRTRDGPNGHVYKRFTKHEDHRELPTQHVRKCVKCGLYVTGTPYGAGSVRQAFQERCRTYTCLEYAYHEFRTGNQIRGAERLETVCDDEGLIEAHQFAEGIGVPLPAEC